MRARLILIVLCLASPAAVHADAAATLRLAFVGDIMTHPLIFESMAYDGLYRGVRDVLQGSDLSFANLEFPVDSTRDETGYPFFNAHRAYVRAAIDAGIRVFSTANNHAFDGREEGVFQTIRTLLALRSEVDGPPYFSGTRGNQLTAFAPVTITVNGVRVGFIAVTQFLNESDAGRFVHTVDYMNAKQAEAFLSFVREASPFFDLFIVSYHGDREYVQEPDPAKRAFFHRLVENGAQIVFAHHPHVLQGYELVNVGGARRLIMYSMGNFISGMTLRAFPPDPDGLLALTGDSIILRVEVRISRAGAAVTSAKPVLVGNYRNAKGETMVAKLDDLVDGSVDVPDVWAAYFAARRARIEKFLAEKTSEAPDFARTAAR